MRWFRFYAEAVYDPKVQRLPAAMFRQWVNLLCLASLNEGTLPDSEGIGFALHLSLKATENLLCELIDRQLLDTDGTAVSPHNWAIRQYQSDSSAERVNRYRERAGKNGQSPSAYLKHRDAVLERDRYACVYCGSEKNLVIDHVIPIAQGGGHEIENLATACKSCNSGKAGRTPAQAGYTFVTASSRLHKENVTASSLPQRQIQRTETEQTHISGGGGNPHTGRKGNVVSSRKR